MLCHAAVVINGVMCSVGLPTAVVVCVITFKVPCIVLSFVLAIPFLLGALHVIVLFPFNRSYLGMTVHWIDSETLSRQSAALACRRMKGRHTFDVIAKMIAAVLHEFQLTGRVCMITTDSGSNFIKAFR